MVLSPVHLSKYHSDYQVNKNEIDESCGTCGGKGEMLAGFWWGNECKRPLGRPWLKWVKSVKMDFQEVLSGA
jgi:hypothetical protein